MANTFDNEFETPDMDKLSSLAENIVYRLPGCSDLMVRKTIQEVYRDFCRRSCCLLGRRLFDVSPGGGDLCVQPMYGGFVDAVRAVSYNGRVLDRRDYEVVVGPTSHVMLRRQLVPSPGCSAQKVEVSFVEIPMLNSEEAPSWFVQKHGEDICSGVFAKLMSMTGRPWSDPAQAQIESVRYENAVCSSRIGYYSGGEYGNGETGLAVSSRYMI